MVGYQYIYIIWVFILALIWIILFLWRKDTKKEMLIISLIFGLAGPLAEYIYIQDWWKPLTITRTPIGIEDFLFGFLIGGIAAVIYSLLFNKKIKTMEAKKIKEHQRDINFLVLLVLLAAIFFLSFFVLKLNSLISTVLAFLIPTIIIYIKRKDLIKNSLFSGLLTLIIAVFVYQILNLMTPGWIDSFWYFKFIGKIIILGLPLEEIIWFFLAGAFIGPLYEYWKEGKLINIGN